jgi:hypothetical protein
MLAQPAHDLLVSFPVAGKFWPPVFTVSARHMAMLRAGMPEASIRKKCKL